VGRLPPIFQASSPPVFNLRPSPSCVVKFSQPVDELVNPGVGPFFPERSLGAFPRGDFYAGPLLIFRFSPFLFSVSPPPLIHRTFPGILFSPEREYIVVPQRAGGVMPPISPVPILRLLRTISGKSGLNMGVPPPV